MNESTIHGWIQKAENDMKIGRDEMATSEPTTDMVCFHMQQCAEKYLKTFLIFHDQEYPRTHRLAVLIDLCTRLDAEFAALQDWDIDRLTRYATVLRYAEELYMPSDEETRQAMDLAEKVRSFVRGRLQEKGFKI